MKTIAAGRKTLHLMAWDYFAITSFKQSVNPRFAGHQLRECPE